MKNEQGSINWNALAALGALATAVAAVGMCVVLFLSIREDGQRARFSTSLDTLWRLDADWSSPEMADTRSAAATALLAERSAPEVDQVLAFFDEIALLLQRGAVDEELVWYQFYRPMAGYWYASQSNLSRNRGEDAISWEQLERIMPRLLEVESKRHHRSIEDAAPSAEQIRAFLRAEIDAGQCEEDDSATDVRRIPS